MAGGKPRSIEQIYRTDSLGQRAVLVFFSCVVYRDGTSQRRQKQITRQ